MQVLRGLTKLFESFNIKGFGIYAKKLRLGLNLSQGNVARMSGLSVDTLSRIEQGKVIARFDTLIILSEVYKTDLIDVYKNYSSSSILVRYYTRLDKVIAIYNEETLLNLRKDYEQFGKLNDNDPPIVHNSKKQFLLILDGLSEYYKGNLEKSRDFYVESMHLSNPLFSLQNYIDFKYTVLEKRILLLIALSFSDDNDLLFANNLLEHLLDSLALNQYSSFNEKILAIKIITNISYNYHTLYEDKKALDYANQGIDFCINNHITYALANLLARKGVAQHFLKDTNCKDTLQQAVNLMIIEKNHALAKKYIEITHKKYGIQLEL